MVFRNIKRNTDPNILYNLFVINESKKIPDNFLLNYEIEELKLYKSLIDAKESIPNFNLFKLLKVIYSRAYTFGYEDTKEYTTNEEIEEK